MNIVIHTKLLREILPSARSTSTKPANGGLYILSCLSGPLSCFKDEL